VINVCDFDGDGFGGEDCFVKSGEVWLGAREPQAALNAVHPPRSTTKEDPS
jgi:hypothetical protein